jgi:hypothetical protein
MAIGTEVVQVDFAKLGQAGNDLQDASKKLQAQLDQMRSDVAPLRNLWVASNSSAAAAWDKADHDLQNLIDGLSLYAGDFSTRTMTAMETQQRGESVRASMFA